MSKKIVKKKQAEVVSKPDWMEGSNRGSEEVGTEDVTIPRLDVLQDLSPQVKKNKAEYIEDAEPGVLWNTVTKELYGSSVSFIPVYFRKEFVIWKDINSGGGFRGAHGTQQLAVDALQEVEDAENCEIVATNQHYGLLVNKDGNTEEVVISMSKSKNKVSKQLNSLIKLKGPGYDRFSFSYDIKAVEARNPAGQSYYNLTVTNTGKEVMEEQYKKGIAMYEAVKLGMKEVIREESEETDREF